MLALLFASVLVLPSQQASDAQIATWIADDLVRDSRTARVTTAEREEAAGLVDDVQIARQVGGRVSGAGAHGVIVGVHEGEVVLHGRARDAEQREKILALASEVSGVRGVDSRSLLLPGEDPAPKAPAAPEAPLAELLPLAPFGFLTQDGLAGRGVTLRVAEGVVTIHGEACSDEARLYATSAAQRVPGVRAVRNELVVRPDNAATDRSLALMIEREIEGDVLVQTVSNAILVTVRHGVVQLTGKVRDEGQSARAAAVAGSLGATFAVDNRLQVDEDLVLPPRGRIKGFRTFRSP